MFVRDDKIWLRVKDEETEIIDTNEILLPGKHNFENACAATMAAYLAGVSRENIAFVLKIQRIRTPLGTCGNY